MNQLVIFSIVASFFSIAALIAALFCFSRYRHCRKELDLCGDVIDELEQTLAKQKELFENVTNRVSDGARRIAWLETRIRNPKTPPPAPKPVEDEIVTETVFIAPPAVTITERRHRVLTLARHGQDAETIAKTLGMLPGEVELIVSLNRVTA